MAPLLAVFVSPIWDLTKISWNYVFNRGEYISGLQNDLESLKVEKERLKTVKEEVEAKVKREEEQHRQRTYQVRDWLNRVERMQEKVDEVISEGEEEIQKKCLRCFCPKNFCSCDEVGKKISSKLKDMTELIKEGNFDVVTEGKPDDPVYERPMERTVCLESKLGEVWRSLEDQKIGTIGLYGMGGVGKTTLLKKINNEFLNTSHGFDVVIWIVVSKEANLEKVQDAICNKLKIPDGLWRNKNEDDRAVVIFRFLKEKKFVLLLDDLWNQLDLVKVGIPLLDDAKGSKVVFTTRSEEVCGRMGADKSIKVECLAPEEAQQLFHMYVGQRALKVHPDVPKLAEAVAQECKGLPLALITIGRAMASRRKPEDWKYALKVLRSYPSEFSGMGDHVFPILKFSYDSLSDDTLKRCFLYCSIFPEGYNIRNKELIELWIREGFLDKFNDIYDARNQGEYIIESLKLACLLESCQAEDIWDEMEDCVRMHDVLRDMALWCDCGMKENKTLGFAKWEEAERLALGGYGFKNFIETTYFPHLLTLLLRHTDLNRFSSEFFQRMPALRILDLSENHDLTELPVEIGQLSNLEHLNLSNTGITSLPNEVKNLTKLRSLLMDRTNDLINIPREVISSLLLLQVFSKIQVMTNEHFVEGGLLDELECLEHITDMSVTLTTLNSIQKLLSSPKLEMCVRRLSINPCKDLTSFKVSSSSLRRMKHLETLEIRWCPLTELKIYSEIEETMPGFVPGCIPIEHGYFYKLRHVTIWFCSLIKDLTWVKYAPSIETLSLSQCLSLVEIISDNFGSPEIEENRDIFPNLKTLSLSCSANLKSIYHKPLPFPSLKKISVYNCRSLKKLPFDCNSAKNSLDIIEASESWWNRLQWEDEAVKCAFSSKFRGTQGLFDH